MQQLVAWFDLRHVSRSPAQFDPAKLTWLNQHYLKQAPEERLAALVEPELARMGIDTVGGPPLAQAVALLKDRATTVNHLAEAATLFYGEHVPAPALLAELLTEPVRPGLRMLQAKLGASASWDRAGIAAAMKATLAATGLKMPQLAMPVRVIVTGRKETPSVDAVLALLGRERVLARLAHHLGSD